MYIKLNAIDYTKVLPVVPGVQNREWIDKIDKNPYYYDLTMTMASQSGWEFRAPDEFEVEWNGGSRPEDTVVHSYLNETFIFYTGLGNGIVSFKTGYIVQTPDDYAIMVSGAPNFFKDGIVPLSSLYETNWSHIPMMINWKMLTPGKVKFKKDEPIGFMTVIPHKQIENFDLITDSLVTDFDLWNRYSSWADSKIHEDPYVEGITNGITKEKTKKYHVTSRKLKEFTKLESHDNIDETEENTDE